MTIFTFGSTQERSQHCSCVRLNFELRNGRTKQLLLYTVPRICEALSTHPIPPSHGQLDHLKDLHLADCSSGSSELEIDILVGSDQYWDLVTGETGRTNCDQHHQALPCRQNSLKHPPHSLLMCSESTPQLKKHSPWMIA